MCLNEDILIIYLYLDRHLLIIYICSDGNLLIIYLCFTGHISIIFVCLDGDLKIMKKLKLWNCRLRGYIHPKSCHYLLRFLRREQPPCPDLNQYKTRCNKESYGFTPKDLEVAEQLLQLINQYGPTGITLKQIKVSSTYK